MALAPKKEKCSRRKSDPGTTHLRSLDKAVVSCDLPWGGTRVVALPSLDLSQASGSFVGKAVLLDLLSLFQRKLSSVVEDEPIEKLLNKTLQRGGDPYFDNVCTTLHGICEVCLPAVLNVLLTWHKKTEETLASLLTQQGLSTDQRLKLVKKSLAVNYLFCLVLIEILPQVEFHASSCDPMIKKILEAAFKHVQYKDPATMGPNNTNQLVVAEIYSEVIGVLSSTHFLHIHKIFMSYLVELKKETTMLAYHQIIALIMAMKFVKIKTNQVEAFEMGIKLLEDLGCFMIETKEKDVKHAVTGLLVEILLPIAAQIKSEANIPALITLVQKLYGPTTEMASKKQHKLAAYPLQTCLLCVSQRHFFLTNWVPFLNVTLANLKNRDAKISRVALESLYRLLWVYLIRNTADGNTATRSRLESVCGSLFPKGNRGVVPRDAPLNIFVKIIHFIAQQKLDFAFKEIIFDLLSANRTQRSLYAERMNIGVRALMVIADGLQQKDEPPEMPKSMGPSASGTIQKMKKKTYITRPLTLEIARSIGLDQYYTPCKKAFDGILRILDTQIIINVIFLYVEKQYLPQLSAILLKNEMIRGVEPCEVDVDNGFGIARGESPSFAKATAEEYRKLLIGSSFLFSSVGDLLSAIVFCLSESMDSPLWSNEDASPRNWRVQSSAKLSHLIEHVIEALHPSIPMLPIMWTQLAMRMALATPHRHLAGRCFQMVPALQQPPGAWLPSLMSRLVETAGEQHEETQSYVTDLLICIIDCAVHISPVLDGVVMRTSMSPTHHRSTSYTPALVRQSVIFSRVQNHQDRKDARLSLLVSDKDKWTASETLVRSKSADQLKSDMEADEEINSRMQMIAIAISLLESGVDNEFLLALQLLDKVLNTSQQQKLASIQKLEKIVAQLEWKNYSGVVALVSRGAVLPTAYEPSIQAMIRVCEVLGEVLVGGRDSISLLVTHSLPYLLLNFDNPNVLCVSVATAISAFCTEEVSKVDAAPADHPFIHLATVMNQYANKSFTKDSQQFARCVLQYICDGVIALNMDAILSLLSEMLERGWVTLQGFVLHMLYLLVQHNHTTSLSSLSVNAQVIRSVSRHLQGIHWQEASKVYKSVVEKWNTENRLDDLLDFTTKLTPILTSASAIAPQQPREPVSVSGANSPRKQPEAAPIATTTNGFGASTSLKRLPPPHLRVRDRLVGILSASGLRIGLPSATSLVFSRSELGSAASSTERVCASSQEVASTISLPDPPLSVTDSFPRVFKEFDFLDAEHDSVSETTDSCFWWLSTMRQKKKDGEEDSKRRDDEKEEEEDNDEDDDSESPDVTERTSDGRRSVRSSSTEEADDDDEKTPCQSECCRSEDERDDIEEDIEDDAFDGEMSSIGDRHDLLSTSHAQDADGASSVISSVSMPVEYHVQQDFVTAVGELNDDVDGGSLRTPRHTHSNGL